MIDSSCNFNPNPVVFFMIPRLTLPTSVHTSFYMLQFLPADSKSHCHFDYDYRIVLLMAYRYQYNKGHTDWELQLKVMRKDD